MSNGENALNAAGDYIRRHRGKGVPAVLVLALLAGTIYASNLENRVDSIEKRDIPELKEAVKEIKQDIRAIREGDTRYQKDRKLDIEEIKRALGVAPRNPPSPAPNPGENR